MQKPRIGVLGRDAREWYAAVGLADDGYDVAYHGPLPVRGVAAPVPPRVCREASDAAEGRNVLVGPVRSWHQEDAGVLARAVTALQPSSLVIMGNPSARVRSQVDSENHRLVDILQRDDFALMNAVPTAEGAICEAVEAAQITLAESHCLVVGYGRTGIVLAQRLHGLGAVVHILARSAYQRAAARAAGLGAVELAQLKQRAAAANFIFNTVPALILTDEVLARCSPDTVIIDIASEPGGVDVAAVERRGLPFRWPLGIPGRVAPRSAGRILHETVRTIMSETGFPAVQKLVRVSIPSQGDERQWCWQV